jgi:hypothetical protein
MKKSMVIRLVSSFMIVGLTLSAEAPAGAPSVSYRALVEWYSPVIVQDVGCPEYNDDPLYYGDYITRIDYDGDYVGNNNWDNLGYPSKARPLPAYVYYSVLETSTHYFICYALYHPADDFICGTGLSHENDLEGIVMCVKKDGNTYGDLRMVQLQAHHDFYKYTPPGETGIENGDDDINGTIGIDYTYPGVHPVVYVEGGGHGLRHEDTGGWLSVRYYYTGNAEDPDIAGWGLCGYDLLSIFAEMWEQRTNCCGEWHLFDNRGDYTQWGFDVQGLGMNFDGDSGTEGLDKSSPPWNWDDNDDGGDWLSGDWFMHSAGYHYYRFGWEEPFSTNYIFHPFGYNHLGGDIYNGAGGTTTLHGTYQLAFDLNILSNQVLVVRPYVTINFTPGAKITANGELEADAQSVGIRFISSSNPSTGIKLDGQIRLQNGGSIKIW